MLLDSILKISVQAWVCENCGEMKCVFKFRRSSVLFRRLNAKRRVSFGQCLPHSIREYVYIRVQAENEKFSPSTFLNGFDPRIDSAPFFLTSGTVFTYHQGLLARFAKNGTKQL